MMLVNFEVVKLDAELTLPRAACVWNCQMAISMAIRKGRFVFSSFSVANLARDILLPGPSSR